MFLEVEGDSPDEALCKAQSVFRNIEHVIDQAPFSVYLDLDPESIQEMEDEDPEENKNELN